MSYTNYEKKKALDEQNKVIDSLDLDVLDKEKEHCSILFWFAVLISIGICCVAFCILVYGV